MLIVITGASGSGKSYIAEYLEMLDPRIFHIDIDKIGHEILKQNEVKNALVNRFGSFILENNEVSRNKLSKLVFNNKENMNVLTAITWHHMEKEIDKLILENKSRIILLDWLLITKTKYFNMSDMKILIKADINLRINRAIDRDKITVAKFMERENATEKYNEKLFDYILVNSGLNDTKRKVKKIYDKSIVPGKF